MPYVRKRQIPPSNSLELVLNPRAFSSGKLLIEMRINIRIFRQKSELRADKDAQESLRGAGNEQSLLDFVVHMRPLQARRCEHKPGELEPLQSPYM